MKIKSKALLAALCAVLLVGATLFGTLAYLTAETDTIQNVFTIGNITVTLEETKGTEKEDGTREFKYKPGDTIEKDPVATVEAGSEDCYLFIKVEETDEDGILTFDMADGWNALPGEDGVYYREVTSITTDQPFYILKNNQVKISVEATEDSTAPTLTFTAYAVQLMNGTAKIEVADAWAQVPTT